MSLRLVIFFRLTEPTYLPRCRCPMSQTEPVRIRQHVCIVVAAYQASCIHATNEWRNRKVDYREGRRERDSTPSNMSVLKVRTHALRKLQTHRVTDGCHSVWGIARWFRTVILLKKKFLWEFSLILKSFLLKISGRKF